jgi:hypothetical protein
METQKEIRNPNLETQPIDYQCFFFQPLKKRNKKKQNMTKKE